MRIIIAAVLATTASVVMADELDVAHKDALAARGYWQAFLSVKETVSQIIAGAGPGRLVRATHRDWYRELFQPCVAAGLIKATALASESLMERAKKNWYILFGEELPQ